MKITDFDYELPPELIAQEPITDRTASRMMVLDKRGGGIRHSVFRELPKLLAPGDCLVLNNSRVIPARLLGHSGGKPVEILLLNNISGNLWETLAKPGKRAVAGTRITFGEGELTALVEEVKPDGNRLVRLEYNGILNEILDLLGEMPLPPYITKKLEDRERYQTVYSKHEGSAAAPTAGLHFTRELLDEIRLAGVNIAEITLHVGLGTFRPVKAENTEDHHMHAEFFNIDPDQAEMINAAKARGGRVIAVGTTVCRTLESQAEGSLLHYGNGWTDIFIYPGHKFKIIDALITNFHLPKSTLLMLISAMAGRENVLAAYHEAVRERYRFFSFGDAMLIQ
ncbi:MAG: tRNA preQ1(34) S-adenosylmethionine ribosyltransferase-isomerase QueA [Defluviitaleaceae bacterium]|nr:tRNA preQ1(34) S-adenosylmethionine ribosyltransferase-isomerase QueA [Defluviitaleaceae bacterium]MCL2837320.1 tRNA preQ1(34) S-adenosylmethionine ribosyltransferase-isomerase QueA [Defluviitaleaceae bacterium]